MGSRKSSLVVERYVAEEKTRRRRRRRYFLCIFGAFFLVFCFWGARWIFIDSAFFRIRDVAVEGNRMVSADDVTSLVRWQVLARHKLLAELLGTDNMLVWSAAFPPDALKNLPAVRSLAMDKNYRTKEITLAVVERQPYGLWCEPRPPKNARPAQPQTGADNSVAGAASSTAAGSVSSRTDAVPASAPPGAQEPAFECWWFDREGVMFKKAVPAEGNLIRRVNDYTGRTLSLGSTALDSPFIPALLSVFRLFEAAGVSVKEVRVSDLALQELTVSTYDGPELLFSLRFPSDQAASVIQSLRASADFSSLQYVDFRTEGRVFYK